MGKRLAFVSVALTVGIVGASIEACSDSTPGSNFGDPGSGDSGVIDSGPGFNVDASNPGNDASQTVSCQPSLPATFSPVWHPPTRASKCTSDELGSYYDACTADLKAKSCTDWFAAHANCGGCIQPDDNTGPIQTFQDKLYLLLNVAGCLSVVQKAEGGTDTCATAYDAAFQCRRASCDNCFHANLPSSDAAFQAFNTCEKGASCATYDSTQTTACVGYKESDGGAPQCFPTANEQSALNGADPTARATAQKSFYVRVEGITCGP